MALGRVKGGAEASYALAWIDISTGAFRVAETSEERLAADIFRVDPKELIVAEPLFHDEALKPLFDMLGRVASPQPPSLFDSASAAQRIARFYGVATPDSFGAFSRAELSAISGAIAYVEKTQKAERPPLARPEREENGATLFIDPATRTNLELVRIDVGRPRGLAAEGDRPHGDRRRRAAARRPADGAADRPRRRSTSGSTPSPSSRPTRRSPMRCAQALKTAPDMARALSRLALEPRRPARPRRACGRAWRPRPRSTRCSRVAQLPAELAARARGGRGAAGRSAPAISTARWPTSCRC